MINIKGQYVDFLPNTVIVQNTKYYKVIDIRDIL
jgi:hypothetical protein